MKYACPVTITSPAPERPDLFKPNEVCGARFEVKTDGLPAGAPIEVRCPYGHHSFATVKLPS